MDFGGTPRLTFLIEYVFFTEYCTAYLSAQFSAESFTTRAPGLSELISYTRTWLLDCANQSWRMNVLLRWFAQLPRSLEYHFTGSISTQAHAFKGRSIIPSSLVRCSNCSRIFKNCISCLGYREG